jgi:DNA mismatch repair protein MutS
VDPDEITHRLDAVEEALSERPTTRDLRERLARAADLERLGSKIVLGHANARDLIALKRSIRLLPEMFQYLRPFSAAFFQPETETASLEALAAEIESAILDDPPPTLHEGGIMKRGYHPDLDELIQITREGRAYLARLETQERQATGIASLKVRYNKVFGYYIEIPKTHTPAVPAHYVRKQTLVNAERYVTDELKTFELKVFTAQEKRAALEYALFDAIRSHAASKNADIQAAAAFLARLDVLLNLAETAARNHYVRPVLTDDGRLLIEEGRHPVVEKKIAGERFVPNTIQMDNEENQLLIITGPNMAGKSTLLRQAALLVLMAHMGSFVPAQSASIPITDRIFTRVGALDNLSQGQSTFLVEMQETANILHNATHHSLVILDEIGRGISTYDGLSIAWAVAEYLHDLKGKGVKTLFATHYHELTALAESKPRIKNFNVAVKEWNEAIIFLRKLVEGGTNRSYGIQVARLAGIPPEVIEKAKAILLKIESQPGGRPVEKKSEKRTPSQLSLFSDASATVMERLKNIDVLHMTPVEALTCLNELKAAVDGRIDPDTC